MRSIKTLKAVICCIAMVFVFSCATSTVVAVDEIDKAISDGKVLDIEYKIILNENKLGFGSDSSGGPLLTPEIESIFREVNMEFSGGPEPVKKYYYLYAAPTGEDYREKGLIFRVREDRVKPSKSKITLKSRQYDYESLDFTTITKIDYEFDAGAEGRPGKERSAIHHYYNTAYDVNYLPEKDFAVKNNSLEFSEVWSWLDAKYYWLRHMIQQNYPSIVDSEFPGVVDAYRFEGNYADKNDPLFDGVEFTIDYWILRKEGKEERVAEVSFANGKDLDLESKKAFDNYYLEIYKKLYDMGYVSKKQSSKTNIYFRFFGE